MKGEWIDTGDTYIRDADGWFTYCGRSDDMIKVGGIWCSPAEIEARLIEQYRKATQNAFDAGFDGVELHGTSGYLPAQFLSTGREPATAANGRRLLSQSAGKQT